MAAAKVLFVCAVIAIDGVWCPYSDLSDISGPYCQGRPDGECCPGRDDSCTMPILDTLCYCDIFCNRTSGSDCCPDFWSICIGLPPTQPPPPPRKRCFHGGRSYDVGDTFRDNCNICTCTVINYGAAEFVCTDKACLIRPELIKAVNQGDLGWKAANYSFFWGKTLEEGIAQRLGTYPPTRSTKNMTEIRYTTFTDLPSNFDSRERWGKWLQPVRDQGDCAASWAFSSTAVASDRLALMSGGLWRVTLSPQLLISCQGRGQSGCAGGHLDRAWWFLRKHGTSSERCYPYESGYSFKPGPCRVKRWRVPGSKLPKVLCVDGEEDILYLSTPPYRTSKNERVIMQEIYNNGPVQATFRVKEDFYSYRAGIYKHSRLSEYLPPAYRREGWHSVRIIGWGVSSTPSGSVKYWLCANSWGDQWGEGGYFRIVRGSNECDIEGFIVGVWGNLEEFEDFDIVGPIRGPRIPRRKKKSKTYK